jgi:MFS family permease
MFLFSLARTVLDTSAMTSMQIGGIVILEPVTVLTNFVMAAVSWWAAWKLKSRVKEDRIFYFARLFFLFIAIGTLAGGVIGHALLHYTGIWGKIPGWYICMAGVAMLERAAIYQGQLYMRPSIGRFFSIFNYFEIATFMILSVITFDFLFVEMHAFYGLFIVVFCFALYIYVHSKDKAFTNLFIATGWGLIAALCHAMKWSLDRNFNYNDISHIFMTLSVYWYYKAYINLGPSINGHGSRRMK